MNEREVEIQTRVTLKLHMDAGEPLPSVADDAEAVRATLEGQTIYFDSTRKYGVVHGGPGMVVDEVVLLEPTWPSPTVW